MFDGWTVDVALKQMVHNNNDPTASNLVLKRCSDVEAYSSKCQMHDNNYEDGYRNTDLRGDSQLLPRTFLVSRCARVTFPGSFYGGDPYFPFEKSATKNIV